MSDWAVGDLAVCVDVSDRLYQSRRMATAGRRFKQGAVYRVAHIGRHQVTGDPVLLMEGQPGTAGAWRFRKVLPDKHEACESEFVDLLKRSKRKVPTETIVTVDRDGRAYLRDAA